jgi:lipopolysaccharide export system protein LptC
MALVRGKGFHSTAVAWAKVILPLLALALLSTLFMVSRSINPDDAIPFADVDVQDRVREPRMTAPRWSGVTADGAALTLTAADARPQSGGAQAEGLQAVLATPDGKVTTFNAAQAELNQNDGKLVLSGGVQVETADGMLVETEGLTALLDRTEVTAAGAIRAKGPLGDLSAGEMRLTQGQKGYVLLFQNGVKLIYLPPTAKPD